MDISLTLNGIKELTLKPKSERWKEYAKLIKDGEEYKVFRENNSPTIILRQQLKDETKPQIKTSNLVDIPNIGNLVLENYEIYGKHKGSDQVLLVIINEETCGDIMMIKPECITDVNMREDGFIISITGSWLYGGPNSVNKLNVKDGNCELIFLNDLMPKL